MWNVNKKMLYMDTKKEKYKQILLFLSILALSIFSDIKLLLKYKNSASFLTQATS